MSQSRVRYIFTYGTLMSDCSGSQGAFERSELCRHARLIGATRIRGKVYEAGLCPGIILGGTRADVVEGEVWQLPDDHGDLLDILDLYEGCAQSSPKPFPYRRRRIRVRTPHGRRVTAWIYLWCGSTQGLARVKNGRWREPVPVHALAACPNEQRDPVRSSRIPAE